MKLFFGFLLFSFLFIHATMAITFDDIPPVQYKFTEITAKFKNQPILAYTVNEWASCIRESEPGYGNSVGVFKISCNVLINHAQTKADKLCQKFGFDKAAKVTRLWLNSQNPYLDYSTHIEQSRPTVAYFDGGRNEKPISHFPSLLTLDEYNEFVQVDLTKMMSKTSYGVDHYTTKNLASRTPKETVEAMGPPSAIFKIIICGSRE